MGTITRLTFKSRFERLLKPNPERMLRVREDVISHLLGAATNGETRYNRSERRAIYKEIEAMARCSIHRVKSMLSPCYQETKDRIVGVVKRSSFCLLLRVGAEMLDVVSVFRYCLAIRHTTRIYLEKTNEMSICILNGLFFVIPGALGAFAFGSYVWSFKEERELSPGEINSLIQYA